MSENVVTMHGEEFHLEEPSSDVVLRILRAIGGVGVRAESIVSRAAQNPSNRALMFGLLAVMEENDFAKLGSAVLQFEDDRKGRKFIKDGGLLFAPIIEALMINIKLSTDLADALSAFFGGIEVLEALVAKVRLEPNEAE